MIDFYHKTAWFNSLTPSNFGFRAMKSLRVALAENDWKFSRSHSMLLVPLTQPALKQKLSIS